MPTLTRPKVSGTLQAPVLPADRATIPAEITPEPPVQTWEYVLFCLMLICMGIMWGMMMLDLFGSGFWVIFDLPR